MFFSNYNFYPFFRVKSCKFYRFYRKMRAKLVELPVFPRIRRWYVGTTLDIGYMELTAVDRWASCIRFKPHITRTRKICINVLGERFPAVRRRFLPRILFQSSIPQSFRRLGWRQQPAGWLSVPKKFERPKIVPESSLR